MLDHADNRAAGSETLVSFLKGDNKRPFCHLDRKTCWHPSFVCETLFESGEAVVLERFTAFLAFVEISRFKRRPTTKLAPSWTSGLHWTGMRNARSEPMPLPGLTESFYTLPSLLSQFYPLFHSILIGHSSLEHVCTLEALSVIPYHPQLCLSAPPPPIPLLFSLTAPLSLFFLPFVCCSVIFVLLYLL